MESAATPTTTAQPAGPAAGGLSPEASQASPPTGSLKTLLRTVNLLMEEASGALRGRMELFSLELRDAGSALVQMAVLALLAGLLGVTAWFTLMTGIYLALLSLGLHWSLALLAVLFINVGGALAALMRARSLTTHLSFPASRRRLRFEPHTTEPIVPPSQRQEPSDGNQP